jgi:hypothetical protein
MKALISIFQKALVWDYYRRNVLFLLVIVLFSFGFLSGQEHKTIVTQALASYKLLIYIALLWLLYGFKFYLFVLRSLGDSKFYFLHHIKLVSIWKRILVWFYVSFALNQLTFLYAVFMVFIGLNLGKITEVAFILGSQLIIIFIGIVIFEYRISKTAETDSSFSIKLPIRIRFKLPFFLFYHKYLVFKEPVLLWLTKGFSIFSLLFFVWLFPTDEYDERLFGISAIIIAVSHMKICSVWLDFQYNSLHFYQNLPLTNWSKICILYLIYFVLLIPEIYLILIKTSGFVAISFQIQWVIFILSFLFFTHIYQFIIVISEEIRMKWYFFGTIFLFVLVMYKIPFSILILSLLVTSIFLFFKFENKFELEK